MARASPILAAEPLTASWRSSKLRIKDIVPRLFSGRRGTGWLRSGLQVRARLNARTTSLLEPTSRTNPSVRSAWARSYMEPEIACQTQALLSRGVALAPGAFHRRCHHAGTMVSAPTSRWAGHDREPGFVAADKAVIGQILLPHLDRSINGPLGNWTAMRGAPCGCLRRP